MLDEIKIEELKKILHKRDNQQEIKDVLKEYHPYDIAQIFDSLNDQERQTVYDNLSESEIADILSYIDEKKAATYIKEMSYEQGADVLNEMETDDAVDILHEMDNEKETSEYLEQMDSTDALELTYLSNHAENTAGAIMSTNFIEIPSSIDVKEAMHILGYSANDAEVIDPLFVCENEKLVGVLSLQDLIIARSPKNINEIMDTQYIYGNVDEDVVSITNKINDYDIYALPILDNGKLVGIVTMDDALDVASSAIEEDYSKMATISEDDSSEKQSFWKPIFKRIPWLVVLLVISLLISNLTSSFEEIISKITVLWFFNTMILDMAGNAGTQTLAVTVRQLGRNELKGSKNILKYIGREFLVILINSLVLGIISFGICNLFINLLGFSSDVNVFWTSLVIAMSLSIALILTGILGAIIPIIMDKIKMDPAIASGPLITTVNDIIALLVYFGLASLFMEKILL